MQVKYSKEDVVAIVTAHAEKAFGIKSHSAVMNYSDNIEVEFEPITKKPVLEPFNGE